VHVQPTSKREGFTTIPSVTWENIGALEAIREELRMSIVEPIRNPALFKLVGLTAPAGVLLYGPPGCGKTLVAKAVSNESKANFISIKGPELLNKYVGESEKAIRNLFQRAKSSAPCIIFFDELDSLCPKRGSENNSASERVVNQLLTEMDGLEDRKQVFVIAATNRPDIIDPAMLRPGRLDKLLYVPLPDKEGRLSILCTHLKDKPTDNSINAKEIAYDQRCEGFSGADISALVREAATDAIRKASTTNPVITKINFDVAFEKVYPSVSLKDQKLYSDLQSTIRKKRGMLS
jgi:ribosome biogenesis ATPase